jgi:hypothetical protein
VRRAGGTVNGQLRDVEDALGGCYLYTGDYASVGRRLDDLTATVSDDVVATSTLSSLRGMWLHYQAIGLDPAERERLDVSAERSLFAAALEAVATQPDSEVARARALFGLGLVEQVLRGDVSAAAPFLAEARALLEHAGAEPSLLLSEIVRHAGFDQLVRAGDATAAVALLFESLSIREQLAEQGWMCSGHSALSFVLRAAGRPREAMAHAEYAIDVAERLGLRTTHLDAARRQLDESRAALSNE